MSVFTRFRAKRTCGQCGFLAWGTHEATRVERNLLNSVRFVAGAPPRLKCTKRLWRVSAPPEWATLSDQVQMARCCSGYLRWRPGRSPEQHCAIEDKTVEFRRQMILKTVPSLLKVLYAVLIALSFLLVRAVTGDSLLPGSTPTSEAGNGAGVINDLARHVTDNQLSAILSNLIKGGETWREFYVEEYSEDTFDIKMKMLRSLDLAKFDAEDYENAEATPIALLVAVRLGATTRAT